MDQKILKYFASYIEKELGIVYHEANYFQLEHRLQQISVQLGHENLAAFYAAVQSGIVGSTRSLLLDVATNNETSFFRDASIFKALSAYILPELVKNKQSMGVRPVIRLWSAASSSGQEAYSIAMEADAYRESSGITDLELDLLASDVSDSILRRAQEATYSQLEVQRGLPARLLVKYFDKVESERWRVKDSIRRGFSFRKINLLDEVMGLGPFDIVFCRNVLIYQDVENKKKVLNRIHGLLADPGYLFLGAAESLIGLSDSFTQINQEGAIFYKKK